MGCSDSKPAEGGSGAPAEEAALPEKLPHMSHLVKGGAETKKSLHGSLRTDRSWPCRDCEARSTTEGYRGSTTPGNYHSCFEG
mmetsp:Transcript_5572/g.6411  ORF Transcript_5572/g.6411 Transcript_5572/m.6411 type:complete len:83 (-) Transcript_5572:506-754(-)